VGGGSAGVRLELLAGRARMGPAGGDGIDLDGAGGTARLREAPAEGWVEMRSSARLRTSFEGQGSAQVEGPARWSWLGAPAKAAASVGNAGRILRLESLAHMALEWRRGPLRLELPGGVRLEISRAALTLRDLGAGSLELHHQAGLPMTVHWPAEQGALRPATKLLAGGRLVLDQRARARLPAPQRASSSPTCFAPPWRGFLWPFEAAPDRARTQDLERLLGTALRDERGRIERAPSSARPPLP
jgi:hypothetical protein